MKDKLQEITKRAMEQIDAAEEMSALNDACGSAWKKG